tara:strand:- start:1296 stop:1514 length:219 start_codon:yes stop_codon:yes gene_type:complete
MAETVVWEIDDLRKYIFGFLRKEAYLICDDCDLILQWDPNINVNKKYNFYNRYICESCALGFVKNFRGCEIC